MQKKTIGIRISKKRKIKCLLVGELKKPKTAIFFFHGAYSTTLDERYQNMVLQITQSCSCGKTCCILYESSRDMSYELYQKSGMNFDEYKSTMFDKTFNSELREAALVVSTFVRKWIRGDKKVVLHFVGISLGGYLAVSLAETYRRDLVSITLLGCGKTKQKGKKGVFVKMPAFKMLRLLIREIDCVVTTVHGTNDRVISEKTSKILFESAIKSKLRQHIILRGVDHRFLTVNDMEETTRLTNLISYIIEESMKKGCLLSSNS